MGQNINQKLRFQRSFLALAVFLALFFEPLGSVSVLLGQSSLPVNSAPSKSVSAAAPTSQSKPSETPVEPQDSESVQPLVAAVYHCNDGDTCRVKVAGGLWLNVRLAAIDAPETSKARGSKQGQPFGDQAKAALNAKVVGKKIQVRQVDLDPFNRPVVLLIDQGQEINLQMIEEGLAEVYRGKTKRLNKAVYLAAEEKAKRAKKGIWSLDKYQSPKEFRQEQKQ